MAELFVECETCGGGGGSDEKACGPSGMWVECSACRGQGFRRVGLRDHKPGDVFVDPTHPESKLRRALVRRNLCAGALLSCQTILQRAGVPMKMLAWGEGPSVFDQLGRAVVSDVESLVARIDDLEMALAMWIQRASFGREPPGDEGISRWAADRLGEGPVDDVFTLTRRAIGRATGEGGGTR